MEITTMNMAPRIIAAAFGIVLALGAGHARAAGAVLKISVLTSGVVLVNGERTMVPLLEPELVALKAKGGEVWYFREGDNAYPGPSGMMLFGLLIKHRVRTSLSDRADFSDLEEREKRRQRTRAS
jgi:hypothetical protein